MQLTLTFKVIVVLLVEVMRGSDSSKADGRLLAPCQLCKALVSSFLLGMERTSKAYYNDSAEIAAELRLKDINESLCSEIGFAPKRQCLELVVDNKNLLEEWWYQHRNNPSEDLLTWFCINKLEVCCPENHFGPTCLQCPGYPDKVCSGHGKCKGNGTRKGNGECSCDIGYRGKMCNNCAKLHYEAYKDEDNIVCSACHKACQSGCTGAGAKNCESCKEGWEDDDDRGCIEVNECLMEKVPCKKNQFCINTEGSFACIACDKSCEGCFGDGPDMCEKCAEGFMLIDKLCIDNSSALRDQQIDTTRYFTYFGLCVATCIIFQKNIAIASVIGVVVGVYIATSEYLLSEL